jgi:hypothetical protein
MNDDGLAFFQTERVVDALQRGQPRDRDRTGMPEIQPPGYRRGLVGGRDGKSHERDCRPRR